MVFQTLKWVGGAGGYLEIIDQRKLPVEFVKLRFTTVEEVFEAIRTLAVRGAPAIGVAGAYGLVLALQKLPSDAGLRKGLSALSGACDYLGGARPTAVNLFRALEQVRRQADKLAAADRDADIEVLRAAVLRKANAIYQEDVDMCLRIGRNGERFVQDGVGILTHCNAGALATAGQGTALSILFEAHKKGKRFAVYVDETRPLLQGSRLTAWELKQAGIDVTVICDNMAGGLMKQNKVDAVITGADRIAANGDTANKIGTYSLAVLASKNDIPFYVAAPSSTFDLVIPSGEQIPIEQRAAEEVTTFAGARVAPEAVDVYNPAFDVTEASLITAIITEKGVIEKPNGDKIAAHLKSA
jgi:methylthioribose-1-phosphate isomerase